MPNSHPLGGSLRFAALALAALLCATAVSVASQPAEAAVPTGVGATSIASPASGSRFIYVSPSGTDVDREWKAWANSGAGGWVGYNRAVCLADPSKKPAAQDVCVEPTAAHPLKTIQQAIRVAHAGDVIVVRAGTYPEAIGWAAVRGTPYKHIVLQAYPGERVVVAGTLILKNADYWTVRGMRFVYNGTISSGQSVVVMAGGVGWRLENNEVSGSVGVANIIVQSSTAAGSTVAQLTAAAPHDYAISGNCIHDNRATDTRGTDHNIYLLSGIYSTGGVIQNNLIAGAPRGSNIKAGGPSPALAAQSPRDVVIRNNTLLYAASGITIGLSSTGISTEHNLIAKPNQSQSLDGGIKTYQVASPGKNAVKDSLIAGYASPIREDYGVTAHIFTARNVVRSDVAIAGSVALCTARAADTSIAAAYGQQSQR